MRAARQPSLRCEVLDSAAGPRTIVNVPCRRADEPNHRIRYRDHFGSVAVAVGAHQHAAHRPAVAAMHYGREIRPATMHMEARREECLLGRCQRFRQQYSVRAEDGDSDRVRRVASEFVGNNRCVSFGVLQRRELFANIVVYTDASVVSAEKIARHESSPCFEQRNSVRGPQADDQPPGRTSAQQRRGDPGGYARGLQA